MSDYDPMSYRTWGATKTCKGCRYWSEMLAQCHGGPVTAMCINDKGPEASKYKHGWQTCAAWESGEFGAIDSPGGNPYERDGTEPLYSFEEPL